MKRAYKYRFCPTPEQVELLAQTFGCVLFVYNNILRWRTDAYCDRQEKFGYTQADKCPTAAGIFMARQCFRRTAPESDPSPTNRLCQFLCRTDEIPDIQKQAATFMNTAFKYRDGRLYMAKSKTPSDVRWRRERPSAPSPITISKDAAGRYFVSCLCESEPASLPVTTKTVGTDVGLKNLFVTDTGFKTGNPRHTAKYAKRLALLQRRLSRTQKSSKNRARGRLKVARLHAKIAGCRMDNRHRLSRKRINGNQVVCVESLKVKKMFRNQNLSKAIADASRGERVRQLQYKGERAGRSVVAIDQFFPSSRRCGCCGFTMKKMPPDVRNRTCPECGEAHDGDINAARNINAVGLAV